MDLHQRIAAQFAASAEIKRLAAEVLALPIAHAIDAMVAALMSNGKILACGNGGSAGDCQHFAAELVGRFERERPGLAAIALTTDTSILTAVANHQLREGTALVAIIAAVVTGGHLLAAAVGAIAVRPSVAS